MDRFPVERFKIPRRRSSQTATNLNPISASSTASVPQSTQSGPLPDTVENPGVMSGLMAKYERLPFTLILENTALVARDHMANERTFLAWIRTGFVLMSMGVVFTQMYMIQIRATEAIQDGTHYKISLKDVSAFHVLGMPLTVLTGVLAIFTMIFGFVRYLTVLSGLQQNVFPATRVMVLLVFVTTSVIVIMVLVADINALRR